MRGLRALGKAKVTGSKTRLGTKKDQRDARSALALVLGGGHDGASRRDRESIAAILEIAKSNARTESTEFEG